MSISIPSAILKQATHKDTLRIHESNLRYANNDRDIDLSVTDMPNDAIEEIVALCKQNGLGSSVERMLNSILIIRSGDNSKVIPNIRAFAPALSAFLSNDMINGWLYRRGHDDKLYPELVTDIRYYSPDRDRKAFVRIQTISYTKKDSRGKILMSVDDNSYEFRGEDVTRRNIYEILLTKKLEKETPELRAQYDEDMRYWQQHVSGRFSEKFSITGKIYRFENTTTERLNSDNVQRKAIHDMETDNYAPMQNSYDVNWMSKNASFDHLLNGDEEDDDDFDIELDDGFEKAARNTLPIPEHPIVRMFDLKSHEYYWCHATNMVPHEYDHGLKDKLILPESHRDLLDILTTDLGAFVGDIIEGKSAGNVILCQGIPGVGKTLTAEIYAELINRPLYSVHSGTLGTTAASIEKNLKYIFMQAKRWNAVLLLDEADVFVVQRGGNIEQNAIVAEFLRTLEYFDGLMFMTTNRANDIDEAIISRCAAIIKYEAPSASDTTKIWHVLATQFDTTLAESLVSDLVKNFPEIAPRDIKMLLRLALRVAKSKDEALTLDTFRRCAMFRSIKMINASKAS